MAERMDITAEDSLCGARAWKARDGPYVGSSSFGVIERTVRLRKRHTPEGDERLLEV